MKFPSQFIPPPQLKNPIKTPKHVFTIINATSTKKLIILLKNLKKRDQSSNTKLATSYVTSSHSKNQKTSNSKSSNFASYFEDNTKSVENTQNEQKT